MRILIKINGDVLLDRRIKFLLQVCHKLSYPAIILVVFLAVADEDVILVAGDDRGHRGIVYGRYNNSDKNNPYKIKV
jgi:hypothetical protein